MNDLITKLENLIGKKANVERGPLERADMAANLADITRARTVLGWEPKVSLDEGLRRTVGWYQRDRAFLKDVRM